MIAENERLKSENEWANKKLSELARAMGSLKDEAERLKSENDLLKKAIQFDRAGDAEEWRDGHPIFVMAKDIDNLIAENERLKAENEKLKKELKELNAACDDREW